LNQIPPASTQRKAYVHLIKGTLLVNGRALSSGDAVMIASESQIEISHGKEAEALVFDLHAG
jgi:redox-sensitive bicupin YhaK (pirin superfamily)